MNMPQLLSKVIVGLNGSKAQKGRVRSWRRLRMESLENRQLLAIVWANQGSATNDSDNFTATYGAAVAPLAREIVSRAIADWNAVINDFNYDGDNNPVTTNFLNNTFSLDVFAAMLPGTNRGVTENIQLFGGRPFDAIVRMDDNGAGDGWFFDQTPSDDSEFTGIANAFQASFVDVSTSGANFNDFYRTIAHEIGHAMGIAASAGPLFGVPEFGGLISNRLFYSDQDQNGFADLDGHSGAPLRVYFNGATGVTTMLTSDGGGHFYEGHASEIVQPFVCKYQI